MPFLNPRVLNVVMSCHAFDPESSAVPLPLFYAPPQPTIRPHPQINSSGRALFHIFEVQGVRKQRKKRKLKPCTAKHVSHGETEGLLWMLQWRLVWALSKRANELAWPCSCLLRVWPKCNWQCRMMRCKYSFDVVVLCCIVAPNLDVMTSACRSIASTLLTMLTRMWVVRQRRSCSSHCWRSIYNRRVVTKESIP
jgi:hypothetical protein